MIVRVFRVKINDGFGEEFEKAFDQISLPLIRAQKGLVSFSFGKVIDNEKDEYSLITIWESQDALIDFCGKAWDQALIPHGMEKYINECWVYHFEQVHSG